MITPYQKYEKLAQAIGFSGNLYFKREDLHPLGSHKGRSIPFMIDHYLKSGDRHFAISSSGNAGLAATLYVKEINAKNLDAPIKLDIFVGNNIERDKLEKLNNLIDENIKISKIDRPLQALTEAAKSGARSLRQSTDDIALIGYQSLAEEISSISNIGAVFIGTSSGTTAQSLAQNFSDNKLPIQVHIVQTSSCHPIIDSFGPFDTSKERSVADAIVDIVANRKDVLVSLIQRAGGNGWLATNDDIHSAIQLAKENTGIEISTNSALSIVGAMKAVKTKHPINGAIVCLICGD
ncbi:MAG: PLP-dependent lyase/thiolase [Candidatus Paceibacterota bacterium]|jgi:threonine dehydratase